MAGWLRTERDEPVLSFRITDRCPHDPSTYERMACGHGFCKLCDGFVCCETRTVCRGVGPVIKCNRMHHKLSEYPFLFAEIFSGSGRLTAEMRRVLPRGKVKAPSDVRGRDKVMESNVIAVRTVNLCIIKHSIGDAFSIEHIYRARKAYSRCQVFSC